MDAILSFIRKLRLKCGLTQAQMADEIHISLKAWQKMETGRTKLDLERLEQIAKILETSILEIIWNVSCEHKKNQFVIDCLIDLKLPDQERQLYERLIALKDEQIDYYKQILKNEIINIIKSSASLDI